jgi:ketosteroid isomerase-like protein
MQVHQQLIHSFYTAFQQRDARAMVSCYHPQVKFSDPVFPNLQGREAGAMWSMLVSSLRQASDWRLVYTDVVADAERGSCRWDAHYTFSLTGRKVYNTIQSTFLFKDGKIIQHTDTFDFYRWARRAFGTTGLLLGWTPFF